MIRKFFGPLAGGLLVCALSQSCAAAQAPATLPPGPVPVIANPSAGIGPIIPMPPPATSISAPAAGAVAIVPLSGPPPVPPPGPPPAAVYPAYEDRNGRVLEGDPLLDHLPPPGWFAAVDVGVV